MIWMVKWKVLIILQEIPFILRSRLKAVTEILPSWKESFKIIKNKSNTELKEIGISK